MNAAWPAPQCAVCSLVAPAMNTYMWYQVRASGAWCKWARLTVGRAGEKITAQHIRTLRDRGVCVVDPVQKTLACGDRGNGAMAPTEEIVRQVTQKLQAHEEERRLAVDVEKKPKHCP